MDVVTEITIATNSATVWKLITDTPRYPQWNPYIRELHGDLAPGSPIAFRFALFKHISVPARAQVLAVKPEAELRWAGHLIAERFFRAEHFHLLEPLGADAVRFRHGERFTGIAAWLLAPVIRWWAPARYRAVNVALKLRAEHTDMEIA